MSMFLTKMHSPTKMIPGKSEEVEIKGTEPGNPRTQRIVDRLNKVADENSDVKEHRSAELTPLQADFEKMRHKLRTLVSAVQKYQKKAEGISDARLEIAQQLAAMSEDSPLYDEIGKDVDEDTRKALENLNKRDTTNDSNNPTTTDDVEDTADDVELKSLSLLGSTRFAAAQSTANDNEFRMHILDYVVDWERIVTERIESEIEHLKVVEGDRRHYEAKIEALRKKVHMKEKVGKDLHDSEEDKLDRNEEKLKEAFEKHEREAGKVCALLEAVTKDGYKDLYPLVKNYLKWDMNRISRENDVADRLSSILESLKQQMKNEPAEQESENQEASQQESNTENNKSTEPSKDQPETANAEQ